MKKIFHRQALFSLIKKSKLKLAEAKNKCFQTKAGMSNTNTEYSLQ